MKFLHEDVDLGYYDLEAVTTDKGRHYEDPDGNKYPSITTVLSILSEEAIQAWRARVGEEEANRISTQASTRGTKVHNIIEEYLKNNPDYLKDELPHNIQTFKDIQPILDECVTKIYRQEAPLYSKHLGVAGRVDLVGQWKGIDSIIDWKTSRKFKKKEWISSYFMQCAAYAIMWEERTGQPMKQLVVCIAGDMGPQVFVEDRDNWTKELINTINEYKRRKMFHG
jgi:ATP-dependent exoDNAse (exonuclease V) beta subunit|tara:strand:- start:1669 stop:2343 length:675 start_codon:yes stop_codon:yes gene_type:complete